MFIEVGHKQLALTRPYMNKRRKSRNEEKLWNNKLIGRLLLTVTVTDSKLFTFRNKLVIYIAAFFVLNNWKNHGQIDEIHEIIKLEKICASTAENSHNLGANLIIEISLILRSAHVVSRVQDRFVFYINNYID